MRESEKTSSTFPNVLCHNTHAHKTQFQNRRIKTLLKVDVTQAAATMTKKANRTSTQCVCVSFFEVKYQPLLNESKIDRLFLLLRKQENRLRRRAVWCELKIPWSHICAFGFYWAFAKFASVKCKRAYCVWISLLRAHRFLFCSFDYRYQKWCHFQYITYLFFIMSPDVLHRVYAYVVHFFFFSIPSGTVVDCLSLMTAPAGGLRAATLGCHNQRKWVYAHFFSSHHCGLMIHCECDKIHVICGCVSICEHHFPMSSVSHLPKRMNKFTQKTSITAQEEKETGRRGGRRNRNHTHTKMLHTNRTIEPQQINHVAEYFKYKSTMFKCMCAKIFSISLYRLRNKCSEIREKSQKKRVNGDDDARDERQMGDTHQMYRMTA